jgi:hypothetical protein
LGQLGPKQGIADAGDLPGADKVTCCLLGDEGAVRQDLDRSVGTIAAMQRCASFHPIAQLCSKPEAAVASCILAIEPAVLAPQGLGGVGRHERLHFNPMRGQRARISHWTALWICRAHSPSGFGPGGMLTPNPAAKTGGARSAKTALFAVDFVDEKVEFRCTPLWG